MAEENAFVRGYRSTAIVVLNIGIGLVLVNLAMAAYYGLADQLRDPPLPELVQTFGEQVLMAAYPGESMQSITEILNESWSRPHSYRPLSQFAEPPYEGKHVNVDAVGFRRIADQAVWPPDPSAYNVFVFGGSIAFGYGVRDGETVASHLQPLLSRALARDVHVYNFGVSFYYSTLERNQLQELLLEGFVPDAAIFLDGLNEFHHERPFYSTFIERWWREELDPPFKLGKLKQTIPMLRAAAKFRDDMVASAEQSEPERHTPDEVAANGDKAIHRFLENKRQIEALARAYDVETVFVWQPIPMYKYDLSHHLFAKFGFPGDLHPAEGYQAMATHVAAHPLSDNFLWCADMQASLERSLYIDRLHYSAEFSQMVAAKTVELIEARGLLRTREPAAQAAPTSDVQL